MDERSRSRRGATLTGSRSCLFTGPPAHDSADITTRAHTSRLGGLVDDMLCLTKPWGFDVAEVRVRTRIIYGLTDVIVPRQHGDWLARNGPNAEIVIDEGAGHISDAAQVTQHYGWLVQPRPVGE